MVKTSPKRLSSTPLKRPLSDTVNQPLYHLVPSNSKHRFLDSCITFKESTKAWLDLHTNWCPERLPGVEAQDKWRRQLFQDDWTRPIHFFLAAAAYLISPSLFLEGQWSYQHFSIYCKRGKTFWLLDPSPETPICSWCQRYLGLICRQSLQWSVPLHSREIQMG